MFINTNRSLNFDEKLFDRKVPTTYLFHPDLTLPGSIYRYFALKKVYQMSYKSAQWIGDGLKYSFMT